MNSTAEPRQLSLLGCVLLAYLLCIIGVITLLPFRFQWPTHLRVLWGYKWFDVIANVCLFLPLGFLYRLARRQEGDLWCLQAAAFGVTISIGVELVQLFLRGRYSSPIDVLTNGLGAWLGAVLHYRVKRRLNERLIGQFALELPLMNLFYLLLPLLWLNGLASGSDLSRLWLVPLLGLCGGSILATLWTHRLQPAGVLSANALALVAAIWFLVGAIPGFATRPILLALIGLGVALIVRLDIRASWWHDERERRFERVALRRVGSLYAVYMVLLALWPWPWIPQPWRASLGFAEVADIPGVIPTLRVVEYITAFTLFGYMVAEFRGRRQETSLKTLQWLLVYGAIGGGLLELVRGFHPGHIASLAHLIVALGATLYGGMMYRLQLASIQRLLYSTS